MRTRRALGVPRAVAGLRESARRRRARATQSLRGRASWTIIALEIEMFSSWHANRFVSRMSIDGFERTAAEPYVGYDVQTAERFWTLIDRASDKLRVEVEGAEKLREGPGLIVMNHAFGWDAMLPMAAIRRVTGRRVWALGEHLWWKIPFLRELAVRVGTVDGTQRNVDKLLADGELVLVLPGGLRESMKPVELRYRMLWGERFGFVRAALRHRTPLVPLAGIGADEVFELVGDAYARGRRWLHRDFPIPRPSWGLPIIHRHHLKYVVGDPIETLHLPEETDEHAVNRLRREVRGALAELIDEALAQRLGVHP